MKVFYSWQSDIDEKINRYFIYEALKRAAKKLRNEGAFDIEIDQATRDEPGTPDITDTIFKKIDECSIFIADISFINTKTARRRTPNPNVLIELGYAIKKIGFEKIILIFNDEFGKLEKLPFDINHRRPMQYSYTSSMEKKMVLDNLVTNLENAILLIDRKTMTQEKVEFNLYNKKDGIILGKQLTVKGVIYQKLSKKEFLDGINFNEIKSINKEKYTAWQKYLYDIVKKNIERKMAFDSLPKNQIYLEAAVSNSFENKEYYEQYMVASLLRLDSCRIDFSIKNNNEQNMKNIKIVLKSNIEIKMMRFIDFPSIPSDSFFPVPTTRLALIDKTSLFIKREQGNYTIFEYSKDYLYSDEEYILDEPLYIPLFGQDAISIKYFIYSDNLPKIEGSIEIRKENEIKILSPLEVFTKL